MRNAFWNSYCLIAFKASYYKVYQGYAEKRLFWSKAICACVSILSVLIWSVSRSMPVLWACLIALAQLAQTLTGFLPWSQQAAALRYLVPELDTLLVEMYKDWLLLGNAEEDDKHTLAEQSAAYQRRFYELANRYTADIWFPNRKRIYDAANEDFEGFINTLFPSAEGANNNETNEELPGHDSPQQEPAAEHK